MNTQGSNLVQTLNQLNTMTQLAANAAAAQDQHVQLQRIAFDLDSYFNELLKVRDLVKFAETSMNAIYGWKSNLGIQQLVDFIAKLREQYSNGNWNYFLSGIEIDVDKRDFINSITRIIEEIDSLWEVKRDELFSDIDLDFEVPQEILRFLDGSPRMSASFLISIQLLKKIQSISIEEIWTDEGESLSGLNDYLVDLSTRITDCASEIRPVKEAITALPKAVSQFLTAASKDEATINQVLDLEVQDWLKQDANLVNFFRIRTHSS